MPDSKITALTALTAADPANDMIPIVDVSDTPPASGNTKRISINNLLACSPSATLASATITGALGAAGLNVTGATIPANGVYLGAANNLSFSAASTLGMTLNANGLGVGTSPSYNIDVLAATLPTISVRSTLAGASNARLYLECAGANSGHITYNRSLQALQLGANGGTTAQVTLDSVGNVGIGVTPSAWTPSDRALQFAYGNSIATATSTNFSIVRNAQELAGGWTYSANGFVQLYNLESDGGYKWYTAASGTASNPVSFGSAKMTLDASGNLLVGTTNASFGTANGFRTGDIGGRLEIGSSSSTNANIGFDMYSTGAAAYRFYVGWGGTVFATNTTISAISDARLKENVQDIDVGLGAILALKPRKFDWKAGKGKDIKGDRGFIAQEFETVFPNLIDEWKDEAPEGEAPYKSVRQDLIPVLVKAIQELTAEVNALKKA